MSLAAHTKRIHPLVAVAAAAVTLFSLLGIAAITGLLPSSFGSAHDNRDALQAQSLAAPEARSADTWESGAPLPKTQQAKPAAHKVQGTTVAGNAPVQVANAPAQTAPAQPAPVAHKAPQNSPVGIGVGAVVGGVLGNQVGSGDGKTLATIIGAVGGGYIGNEIAKKNQ